MSMTWDDDDKVWRDEDGNAIPYDDVITARNDLSDEYEEELVALALLFLLGKITSDEWREQFKGLLLIAISHGYIFGRGGIERMQAGDWERVAEIVVEQSAYADAFVDEVEAKIEEATTKPTPEGEPEKTDAERLADALEDAAAITAARAALYSGPVVDGFEEGHVVAVSEGRGALVLPVYPTQRCECQSRCRCYWLIALDDVGQRFLCYWLHKNDDAVCPTCRSRGDVEYTPLIIPYDGRTAPEHSRVIVLNAEETSRASLHSVTSNR